MRRRALVLTLVVLAPVFAGCTDAGPGSSVENPIEPCGELDRSFEPSEETNPRIRMETTNGTMTVLVYGHQVPFTAAHLSKLVHDEIYEDTRFHRIVPGQFLLGGDPRSSSEDREAWGTGGYNFRTIDEHHQFLRHDEAGIVSLWSPRPNGAGSQFLVTLKPQPQLDDKNPVFGKVIDGMDTVWDLAEIPTDDKSRPQYGARVDNVTWIDPPQRDAPPPEMTAYGYDCEEVAEPGGQAEYLIAVRNTGASILNGTFETSLEEGWNVTLRNAEASQLAVPSGQTVAYGLNVTVPEDAETGTEQAFAVNVTGDEASTGLELTTRVAELGEPAGDRETVELHYVGVLEDGRAFETTETVYTEDPSVNWFQEPPENPQPVTLDTAERTQFGELVERAHLGETVVDFFPPQRGPQGQSYGEHGLGGRLLVFQVHVTAAS